MDQVKHARMPMATNEKLDLDKEGKHVSERPTKEWFNVLSYS